MRSPETTTEICMTTSNNNNNKRAELLALLRSSNKAAAETVLNSAPRSVALVGRRGVGKSLTLRTICSLHQDGPGLQIFGPVANADLSELASELQSRVVFWDECNGEDSARLLRSLLPPEVQLVVSTYAPVPGFLNLLLAD